MMEESQPSNHCLHSIYRLGERQFKITYTPMEEERSQDEKTVMMILTVTHLTHSVTSSMINKEWLLFQKLIF